MRFHGLHHVKLPVSDLAASLDWYRRALCAEPLPEAEHRKPDGELFAHMLRLPGTDVLLELRLAPETAGKMRGYDPLTLAVADETELRTWVEHLDRVGVRHSPVLRSLIGHLVVVPDPDEVMIRIHTAVPDDLVLRPDHVDFDSPWLTMQ